jgi:HD-GYP domain-containing protein (c-di-GMP phosphodiesterase class II)
VVIIAPVQSVEGHLRPETERQLAATRERRLQPLSPRERLGDGAFALGFLACAGALAFLGGGPGDTSPWVILAFVVAFALAGTVEFHTGVGYVSPTQLVFVPMLFALPPAYVPIVVAAGAVAGKLPRIASGRLHPDRWVVALADGWFSVAPALILSGAAIGAPDAGDWPVLLAAFGAQFASDAVVGTVRVWLCLGASPKEVLREIAGIHRTDALLTPIGLLAGAAAAHEPVAGLLGLPLVVLFALFAAERDARIAHQVELERAYRGTALLLGDVIEDDDAYTGEHTRGVVGLSIAVADALGVDAQTRRECELGALLHDVGKLRVPKAIINKPGPLDEDEWAVMRRHTVQGQAMLEQVGGVLVSVGLVVRASHERWDGTGYPDGLSGEAIPRAARIVAACDAYNAMTTDRAYRRSLPTEVAREELRDGAGTQFDPVVVAALLRVLAGQATPSVAREGIDVDVVDPELGALRGEAERHRGALAGQQGE